MISRRQLLAGLAAIGAVAAWPARRLAAGWTAGLPNDARVTLAAAIDRILPGAAAAGALDFLDYWLRRRPFTGLQRDFLGLALMLNQMARQRHAQPFFACAPADQEAILAAFRDRPRGSGRLDSRRVYEQLASLTVESFLGDPKYGGNREQAGWRLAGVGHCWYAPKRAWIKGRVPF